MPPESHQDTPHESPYDRPPDRAGLGEHDLERELAHRPQRPPGWMLPLGVGLVNAVFDVAGTVTHFDILRRSYPSEEAQHRAVVHRADTVAGLAFLTALGAFALMPVVSPGWHQFIAWAAGLRVVLLIITMLRVSVTWRFATRHELWHDDSIPRVVMLALLSYGEAILLFGAVYAGWLSMVEGSALYTRGDTSVTSAWLDAFHLSSMTQMTVGYGDLRPLGWLRLVASAQAMVALLLLTLILSQFVSRLHPSDTRGTADP